MKPNGSLHRSLYQLLFLLWFAAACSQAAPPVETTTAAETRAGPALETAAAVRPESAVSQTPETALLPDTASTESPATTGPTQGEPAAQAPVCTEPLALTPPMTEGPYYKQGSPERLSLLEGDEGGTRIVITGYVLTPDCQPIPGAWLDFWQTNSQGEYDNSGYGFRGHQFAGEDGRYRLETVVPGSYPGRTAHIHVKVQAPDGPVLTTQLFFPGTPGNQSDRIFSDELLVAVEETESGLAGTFDFVLAPP